MCLAVIGSRKAGFLRLFERLSNDNALVDHLAWRWLERPRGSRADLLGPDAL